MTHHRKPKRHLHINVPMPHLPSLPSFRTVFGCTHNRIWWFRVGWWAYPEEPFNEWEWQ